VGIDIGLSSSKITKREYLPTKKLSKELSHFTEKFGKSLKENIKDDEDTGED